MKWTQATGLLATFGLIAAGGVWAGCSSNDNGGDGGTDSGNGNDVNQQKDTGGGNDSGGNDTGTTDGGGINVDASALDCNYYCDSIIAACTTSNNQYLDKTTCVAMCANIPNDAGAGAQSGDSLACRMYHLSVAATSSANAAIHCPHAGPYGFGVCGTLCNDFCEQDFATAGPCKGTNYPGLDACHTYCNGAAGGDAAAGAPGNAATSPSMACREYHLENSYGVGASHCPHAGEDGGGVCN
jgi:hypothetical protein